MVTNDLIFLRRKERVGMVAVAGWVLGLLVANINPILGPRLVAVGWALTALWVALDAPCRGERRGPWAFLTLVTGPLGWLMYILLRKPTPTVCLCCGTVLSKSGQVCPTCGMQAWTGRLAALATRLYSALANSLSKGPAEQALHTAKHMSIALVAFAIVCAIIAWNGGGVAAALFFLLCFAAYWVLVAWWVYLDAKWRRMGAIPWAILTLVTNVFGLVTYLVIRYPNPRACPQCGAYLTIGLKRCPYCGSEAEPTCPRCQAAVKADWVFCPSCSAQLPTAQAASQPHANSTPLLSVRGTVVDATTGRPLSNAQIKVDSKSDTSSTLTDDTGKFVLAGLEPRPYVLIASAPGYSDEAKALSPSADGAAQVHFSLRPTAQEEATLD